MASRALSRIDALWGSPLGGPVGSGEFARAMAAEPEPRHAAGLAQCFLPFAWPSIFGGCRKHLIYRTAVYGPVRTVVWRGELRGFSLSRYHTLPRRPPEVDRAMSHTGASGIAAELKYGG
jgi:hypothetical protein